jgi:hypothetical protein
MSWTAESPHRHEGRVVGSGQCVAYVQQICGMPHTSHWRRGRQVRGGAVDPNTAIATFDADGRYGNHTDGRSHAAVFLMETETGLLVWDQWGGQPVHSRTIRFHGGAGKKANDGDAYYVIEGAETETA